MTGPESGARELRGSRIWNVAPRPVRLEDEERAAEGAHASGDRCEPEPASREPRRVERLAGSRHSHPIHTGPGVADLDADLFAFGQIVVHMGLREQRAIRPDVACANANRSAPLRDALHGVLDDSLQDLLQEMRIAEVAREIDLDVRLERDMVRE